MADWTAYSSDISGSLSGISRPDVSPRPNILAYSAQLLYTEVTVIIPLRINAKIVSDIIEEYVT